MKFDATKGGLGMGRGFGSEAVVVAAKCPVTGVPQMGQTFTIAPENWRFHDLQSDLAGGMADRRASIQVVLDYKYTAIDPSQGGEAPYQRELWTASNRTTRFVEPGGNPALATSLLRVIDAEGKRFATALVSQSRPLTGGGSGTSTEGTAGDEDEITTVEEEGADPFFFSGAGSDSPEQAAAVAAANAQITRQKKTTITKGDVVLSTTIETLHGPGASKNFSFVSKHGDEGSGGGGTSELVIKTVTPGNAPSGGATREKTVPRPEGYFWSTLGKVGLLGTWFEPALSGHAYEVGVQGTPIGPLVARHDAQFGMANLENEGGLPGFVGPIAFSGEDATDYTGKEGKPIKGVMARDLSAKFPDDDPIGGANCKWVPVIRINADDIAPNLTAKPGPPGPPGKDGKMGPGGPQGPKGDKGDKGDTGDAGKDGKAGKDGGAAQDRGGGSGVPCPNVPTDPRTRTKPRGQGNGGNVPFDPGRPHGPVSGGFTDPGGVFTPVTPSGGPVTLAPGIPPDESGQGFPPRPGWPGVTATPGAVGLGGSGFSVPVAPGTTRRPAPGTAGLLVGEAAIGTVANFPLIQMGQPGGAVSVGGQLALLTEALGATRTMVNSLMGGPDYFAGNITAIHQNYPGFPPAGNTIGQWVQGGDEQVVVGPAASPLYALSILEGNVIAGDQRTAASRVTDARDGLLYSTGVFTVGREVGPGVTDYRPLIHLDNDRTQTGLVNAPLIQTTDGSFQVTSDGGVISAGEPVITYLPGSYADGDVPTYDQATGTFVGTPGGSSGTDATSIQTVPVDPTTPTVGQTLVFDGTDWVPTTTFTLPPGYYGNGESGSHVLTGNDTLFGDMHATEVDLAGFMLFTVGFKIYVSEESTFTFNGGALNASGIAGQPGDVTGGGPGGAVQGSGTLGEDGLGGQGSQGAGGGLAGESKSNCYGGSGGKGGDAGETGFAGGVATLPSSVYGRMQDYMSGSTGVMTSRAGTVYMTGGAGGGGGGGQLGGGNAGGGGAGGQRMVLIAPRIIQGSAPGAVYCTGGAGGDGFISGGAVAAGGGGGGGGGDAVYIYEYTDCDLSDTGITNVLGGAGGAGVGFGANGAAGSDGRVTEMTR